MRAAAQPEDNFQLIFACCNHAIASHLVGRSAVAVRAKARSAALDSVSRVKKVLGSIPPATATEIK